MSVFGVVNRCSALQLEYVYISKGGHVWSNPVFGRIGSSAFLNNKFVLLLLVLLLVGLNVLVLSKISFVPHPLAVLIKTIVLPIILSGILYYLLNPLVDVMEKWKIKRGWSILILYLVIAGILTIVVLAVIPSAQPDYGAD